MGMLAHACNTRICEVDARGLQRICGQPWPDNKLQAN